MPNGRVLEAVTLEEAFQKVGTDRVLIVWQESGLGWKLEEKQIKQMFTEIGREPPIIVWDNLSSGDLQLSELENFFIKSKAWQTDPSNKRDMITHERFLSGFEWPCLMWINFKEDGPSKDVVMRAVSTLVKVTLTEDIS